MYLIAVVLCHSLYVISGEVGSSTTAQGQATDKLGDREKRGGKGGNNRGRKRGKERGKRSRRKAGREAPRQKNKQDPWGSHPNL